MFLMLNRDYTITPIHQDSFIVSFRFQNQGLHHPQQNTLRHSQLTIFSLTHCRVVLIPLYREHLLRPLLRIRQRVVADGFTRDLKLILVRIQAHGDLQHGVVLRRVVGVFPSLYVGR